MAGNTSTLGTINTAWKGRTGAPKGGIASFNGTGAQTVFNIAHGLGAAPTVFWAVPASEAAWARHTVTAGATNIVVTFTTAPATGTNNVKLSWGGQILR